MISCFHIPASCCTILASMKCKSKSGLGLDLDLSPIFIENGLDSDLTAKSRGLGLDLDLRIAGLAHYCLAYIINCNFPIIWKGIVNYLISIMPRQYHLINRQHPSDPLFLFLPYYRENPTDQSLGNILLLLYMIMFLIANKSCQMMVCYTLLIVAKT